MFFRSHVAIFFAALSMTAQTFTGAITGVVSDASGAGVPGASVTLTNAATRELRAVESTVDGRYTFSQIQPGAYSVKAVKAGFRDVVTNDVRLSTSQTLELNLTLTIGQVAEAVEVVANAGTIDTQTANQMVTLGASTVQELPAIARNPLVLFHTQAGVVAPRTGISGSNTDQNQNRFSINGGRDEQVAYMIDGIPSASGDWGGAIASPIMDSVAEFQITRNAYDARFGRTAGGVIQITTKGGGQQWHGLAYEYARNSKLDANSFFNNRNGVAKAPFRRNMFGGNLSGPIVRKINLYGFFGAEFLRESTPATRIATLPTAAERSGDFTQSFNANGTAVTMFDPSTTRPDPNAAGRFIRDAFPGNRIPSTRFDPVATKVLGFLPGPTSEGRGPARLDNFVRGGLRNIVENERYDGRVDWVSSDKHSLFARFTKAPQFNTPPFIFAPEVESARYGRTPRWSVALGNTFVLNPTTVISVLAGAGKFTEENSSVATGVTADRQGLPANLVAQLDVPTPAAFGLANYYSPGNSNFSIAARSLTSHGVHASKQFTKHSLKAGWYVDRYYLSLIETTSISLNFDRFFTAGPDPDVRGNINQGNTIGSFLLGTGSGGNAPNNAKPTSVHTHWNLYVHDTWNVNRRLTVNAGLRWELQRARTERYNRLNWFDSDVASPLGQKAGIPSLRGGLRWVDNSNRFQWDSPHRDFAPRIGIAYKITDKIVWRGGYGIYLAPTSNVGPVGNDGYSLDNTWLNSLDNGRTAFNLLRNPFPQGLAQPTGASAGLETAVGFNIRSFQRKRPTPYMQQFSTDVQMELGKRMLLEVGFAGSEGRKLAYGYNGFYEGMNINQLTEDQLKIGAPLNDSVPNPFFGIIQNGPLAQRTVLRRQLIRPYPQFQDTRILDMPGAFSHFQAFLVRWQRRFEKGGVIMASYQRSHAEDNSSENQGWEVNDRARNIYNLQLEKSVSAHDVPHSFALTYVYEVPIGKGRKIAANAHPVVDAVIGGWQWSAIWKMDSGLPLLFSAPNNNFSFSAWQFPNVKSGTSYNDGTRTIERWFNTAAFEQPAPFTFGNAPRFIDEIRYSRVNNWDMSLAKNFTFWRERLKLQYRAEMFNAFNRVQFGRADTNFGGANFGRVTGTAPGNGPRTIQMALRLQF